MSNSSDFLLGINTDILYQMCLYILIKSQEISSTGKTE